MNAYELTKDRADILADELLAYHHKGVCGRAAKMLRQQADRIAELEKQLQESAMNYISICSQADEHYARVQQLEKEVEHYKNKAEYLDKRELELLAEVKELHKIAQVMAMQESDARKSLNFSKDRIAKYEQVLNAIANDYHELSDHKIEVQVRNHKKWARDVLSLSGNNAKDVSNISTNLQNGKE